MRPILHYQPSRGWMNDPNGLIYWRGRHHLYYQYNPDGTEFANQHWGHASSADLVSWTEHPVALAPGGHDAPYDSSACFSGCAFVVEGRVAILYTGVEGDHQLPCLAYAESDELLSFVKDAANPVIDHVPAPDITVMRDHSVWTDGPLWRQAMAGASLTDGAAVFAFNSTDLHEWSYDGVLMDSQTSGVPGPVWECPDVFRLDGIDVVIVSVIRTPDEPGPEVWWVTGALSGGKLQPSRAAPLDVGNLIYAPQSYWTADGRRIMIGWLRTHLDPAVDGSVSLGAMSLPRQLTIDDGCLMVTPARELTALRRRREDFEIGPDEGTTIRLDRSPVGELLLDAAAASCVSDIRLIGSDGETLLLNLAGFSRNRGALTLFWDAGIVEIFRGGAAGAWSDLRVLWVSGVHLSHPAASQGSVTVWEFDDRDHPSDAAVRPSQSAADISTGEA